MVSQLLVLPDQYIYAGVSAGKSLVYYLVEQC